MTWQRFSEGARKVVFFAQEEAGKLGENYVSSEHLLLGLVRDTDNIASRILSGLGTAPEIVRAEVEQQVTRGTGRLGEDMQLTPSSKRVIDFAYEESRLLSNDYIGTEHLLLGLVREEEGLAGRVLAKLGIEIDRTRVVVKSYQGAPERSWQHPPSSQDRIRSGFSQVFGLAYEEARRFGNDYVGAEHLLLALLREDDGIARRVLEDIGLDLDEARARVKALQKARDDSPEA